VAGKKICQRAAALDLNGREGEPRKLVTVRERTLVEHGLKASEGLVFTRAW